MANNIRITADMEGSAQSKLKALRTDLDDLPNSKGIGSIASGFGMGIGLAVFNAGVAGIEKGVGAMEDMIGAAMKGEQADAKLNQALENYGSTLSANTAQVEESVKAGVKKGFTDDEQKDSLARLVTATGNLNDAQRLQADAMDLARLKGISLADATSAMTKIEAGQYRALKDLGIVVVPVTAAQDALAKSTKHATDEQTAAAVAADKHATQLAVMAEVEKRAGGQADAFSATTAGAGAKMNATWDLLQEKIGTAVLPALTNLANVVSDQVMPAVSTAFDFLSLNVLPRVGAAFETFSKSVLPPIENALGFIAKDVLPALGTAFDNISTALKPVTDAFGAILADQDALGGALIVLAGIVSAVVIPPFLTWAAATIAATWPIVAVAAGVAALLIVLDKLGVLDWLGKNVLPMVSQAFDWFGANVLPKVSDALGWIGTNVLPPLSDAFDWIAKNVLPPLGAAFGWLADNVLAPLAKTFTDIANIVLPILGGAFGAIADDVKTAMGIVMAMIQPVIDLIGKLQSSLDTLTGKTTQYVGGGLGGLGTGGGSGGSGAGGGGGMMGFANGGVIPGYPGEPRIVLAHGGETVTPANQSGTVTLNVYNPSPEPASTSIRNEMLKLAALGYVGG